MLGRRSHVPSILLCLSLSAVAACSSSNSASRDSGSLGGRGGAGGTGGSAGARTAGAAGASAGSGGGATAGAGGGAGAPGAGGAGMAGGAGPDAAAGAVPDGSAQGGTGGGQIGSDAGPDSMPAALGPAGFRCPPGPFGAPLPANPTARVIRGGFTLAEGPVWIAGKQILLFSDFPLNATGSPGRIRMYTPADGGFSVWKEPVDTNGLALDHMGALVAASQDRQGLTRFNLETGARTNIEAALRYMGNPFNSPNDVVVRADGNIYFTDPSYQRGSRPGQDAQAYYRLSPSGELSRLGTGNRPNGIALSPDGKILYVADTASIRKHTLDAAGAVVGQAQPFTDPGSDGMGMDCAGNLYLTSGGRVHVRSPAGQNLGSIGGIQGGFITNVAFGGQDNRRLYVTSNTTLHEIQLEVPGFPN